MKAAFEGYSFKSSENVIRTGVHFRNRYGIELAGDLYVSKSAEDRLVAIAVCGPFGVVKEQAPGLYADGMASRGSAALALDPSPIGESGGETRNVVSSDINTKDFSTVVDVLSSMNIVDPEKIGTIGICGFGGMALNAAAMDTRIRAVATSTMYDMTRANAKDYFDQNGSVQTRYEMKKTLNAQRIEDSKSGIFARAGGIAGPLPDNTPFFVKDYCDYYKTERGYAERSLDSNESQNKTSSLSPINMSTLQYNEEIRSAALMIHGEKVHPHYFSRDAFSKLTGGNKELPVLPGTIHTDLYDKKDKIPFHKIESPFMENLCQGRSQ